MAEVPEEPIDNPSDRRDTQGEEGFGETQEGEAQPENPKVALINEIDEDFVCDDLEQMSDIGIIRGLRSQEKEDLFKTLLVRIDNYNKYLVEEVESIPENESGHQQLLELEKPILNAHRQLCAAAEHLKRNDVVLGLSLYYSARERWVKVIQILDEDGSRIETFTHHVLKGGEQYYDEGWVDRAKENLFGKTPMIPRGARLYGIPSRTAWKTPEMPLCAMTSAVTKSSIGFDKCMGAFTESWQLHL